MFIPKSQVPPDEQVTCATMVCDFRPLKEEKYRVRMMVGGHQLAYGHDAGYPVANLLGKNHTQ